MGKGKFSKEQESYDVKDNGYFKTDKVQNQEMFLNDVILN